MIRLKEWLIAHADLKDRWYVLLLLLAIPVFLVFSPILVGDRVTYWNDGILHGTAYFTSWSHALSSGDSFLWEPLDFLGYPRFATAFGFFLPWNYVLASILSKPIQFILILQWQLFLFLTLGAFFSAKLIREFGAGFWPAYIGGIAFAMSNRIDYLLPITISKYLLIPLLFYLVWWLYRTRSWWYVFGVGLVIGWGLLGMNFQEILYALVMVVVFGVFLMVQKQWPIEADQKKRFAALMLLALVLGGSIGLVQLLPSALFASVSTRSGGLSYVTAAEDPILPTDFFRYLIPGVRLPLGIPFGSSGSDVPFHMGIIPFFFLIVSFFGKKSVARFFKWAFLAIVATAFVHSPIFLLMTKLPVFSYFRVPSRWMGVGVWFSAILVGLGAEWFRTSIESEAGKARLRKIVRRLSVVVALVVVLMIILNGVLLFFESNVVRYLKGFFADRLYHAYQPDGAVPIDHYFGIIDRYFGVLHHLFSFQSPLVLTGVLMLLVGLGALFLVFDWRASLKKRMALLGVISAATFVVVNPFTYATVSRAVYERVPDTAVFLQSHPGRLLSHQHEIFEETVVRDTFQATSKDDSILYRTTALVPNLNLYYGIDSVIQKEGLQIQSIAQLLSYIAPPTMPIGVTSHFPASDLTPEETLVVRKSLLDFLGIKYIISGFSLDESVFPKVFETQVTSKQIPFAIYENTGARPLLYFADDVEFTSDDGDTVLDRFVNERQFSGTIISCGDACPRDESVFSEGSIELIERKNTFVRMRTTLSDQGLLVFSENYFPGWRATIDGEDVSIHRVNAVFMGVVVPPGERTVIFQFSNACASPEGFLTCFSKLVGD